MADTRTDNLEQLARELVELARGVTIAAAPFLAASTGILTPRAETLPTPFATDGGSLYIDPRLLLGDFARTREIPSHAYAHTLAHCILLHPFVGEAIDRAAWDLAADIVADSLADELLAKTGAPLAGDAAERDQIVRGLASELGDRLTTERLYHLLRRGAHTDDRGAWADLFHQDDHARWYPAPEEDRPKQRAAGQEAPQTDMEQTWRHTAQSLRVDLETLSRKSGTLLASLLRELSVGAHEQEMDYRAFLRQFAVDDESIHLSDDEFDYVFYTYGLELYGDMPLIEPLEYRQERRVRDFAIVIDTSSSVTEKVVQDFIDATYDVLTSEGGFFERTCIHIVQADRRVTSDTRITSAADLDRWRRGIHLFGGGGTDFRPAIDYVRRLQAEGEFSDLRGLVYFTDGWGIYPSQMPPFKCAFVFYDEDHRPEIVPSWAQQLVFHPGQFETMSVYGRAGGHH